MASTEPILKTHRGANELMSLVRFGEDPVAASDSKKDLSKDDSYTATKKILERRLQKAITANTKWQQKYKIETKVL